MKLLSVAVPCYNSAEYMEKTIRSILTGGDRVELIIVDDGSKDNTLEIANKYQRKFPDIVKVVHQENGGHGEAVNTGIKNATGLYFKVVDSDDCLAPDGYCGDEDNGQTSAWYVFTALGLYPGLSCPFLIWSSFMRMKVASLSVFE